MNLNNIFDLKAYILCFKIIFFKKYLYSKIRIFFSNIGKYALSKYNFNYKN